MYKSDQWALSSPAPKAKSMMASRGPKIYGASRFKTSPQSSEHGVFSGQFLGDARASLGGECSPKKRSSTGTMVSSSLTKKSKRGFVNCVSKKPPTFKKESPCLEEQLVAVKSENTKRSSEDIQTGFMKTEESTTMAMKAKSESTVNVFHESRTLKEEFGSKEVQAEDDHSPPHRGPPHRGPPHRVVKSEDIDTAVERVASSSSFATASQAITSSSVGGTGVQASPHASPSLSSAESTHSSEDSESDRTRVFSTSFEDDVIVPTEIFQTRRRSTRKTFPVKLFAFNHDKSDSQWKDNDKKNEETQRNETTENSYRQMFENAERAAELAENEEAEVGPSDSSCQTFQLPTHARYCDNDDATFSGGEYGYNKCCDCEEPKIPKSLISDAVPKVMKDEERTLLSQKRNCVTTNDSLNKLLAIKNKVENGEGGKKNRVDAAVDLMSYVKCEVISKAGLEFGGLIADVVPNKAAIADLDTLTSDSDGEGEPTDSLLTHLRDSLVQWSTRFSILGKVLMIAASEENDDEFHLFGKEGLSHFVGAHGEGQDLCMICGNVAKKRDYVRSPDFY